MSESNLGTSPVEKKNLPDYLRTHFSDTQRYLIIWIITGVACGLVAVGFHLSIDSLFHGLKKMSRAISGDNDLLYLGVIGLLPCVGGLISGLILHYLCPSAAGSGIPQTKAVFYRKFGIFKLREAFYRFVAGTISIGFGMSLGREGPTVHICSAIASKIGQWFGLAKKRIQSMVPLGMGAGISAAFNTPMAAVFFVFEELLDDFSSKSFFGIFICVVIAAIVQRIIIGEHPAFDINLVGITTDWWMFLALPLGLFSGLLGKLFIDGILKTRKGFADNEKIPGWLKPAIGGLGVGLIGVVIIALTEGHDGVFAIGYKDLDLALNGKITLFIVALLLMGGKMLASILAYGSGGSGGLFAPTLFIGGMLGAAVGIAAQPLFGYENDIIGAIALLGMGTFFAAVIRCPMTSIVIIWEMTGFYSLILPLMVGNMIAFLISSKFQPVPLYDSLLLQDKINLRKLPKYRGDQDWRNLPVSTIMTFDVISVKSFKTIEVSLAEIASHNWKHHAYPVINESKELLGMVTHHELLEKSRENSKGLVGDLVNGQNLVSVPPEMSIRDAAKTLVVKDVLQVPVVSSKNPKKVIGVLTLHDIARQQNAIEDSMGRD